MVWTTGDRVWPNLPGFAAENHWKYLKKQEFPGNMLLWNGCLRFFHDIVMVMKDECPPGRPRGRCCHHDNHYDHDDRDNAFLATLTMHCQGHEHALVWGVGNSVMSKRFYQGMKFRNGNGVAVGRIHENPDSPCPPCHLLISHVTLVEVSQAVLWCLKHQETSHILSSWTVSGKMEGFSEKDAVISHPIPVDGMG